MAVVEVARNKCGIAGAGSTEFGPCEHELVGLMTEWVRDGIVQRRSTDSDLGGTMRLGAYPAHLVPGSKVREVYGADVISERHRHRYEVNPPYEKALAEAGRVFSGKSPDGSCPRWWRIPTTRVQRRAVSTRTEGRAVRPHRQFNSFIGSAVQQARLVRGIESLVSSSWPRLSRIRGPERLGCPVRA